MNESLSASIRIERQGNLDTFVVAVSLPPDVMTRSGRPRCESQECDRASLDEVVRTTMRQLSARVAAAGMALEWKTTRYVESTQYGFSSTPGAYSLLIVAKRDDERHRRKVTARTVLEGIELFQRQLDDEFGSQWRATEVIVKGFVHTVDPGPTSGAMRSP